MTDTITPQWSNVQKWANIRIKEYRDALEAPLLYEREADILRGRIAELRDLLALTEPKPEVPVSSLADSE